MQQLSNVRRMLVHVHNKREEGIMCFVDSNKKYGNFNPLTQTVNQLITIQGGHCNLMLMLGRSRYCG